MKNPTPGMWVKHFDRVGVIAVVNDAGYAVVRFPAVNNFPFPAQEVVRINELKKHKGKQQSVDDYEPAPF
jgi:hypothetical protein